MEAPHGVESGEPGTDGLALLEVRDVAALLGLSGEAVRGKCRSGDLPAFRLGDGPKARYRIPSWGLAKFMRDAHADRIEHRAFPFAGEMTDG